MDQLNPVLGLNTHSKLPNYKTVASPDTGNGVFFLDQLGVHYSHKRTPGPVGFDLKKYPLSGMAWDPDSPTYSITIWNGGPAFILYAESSPKIERLWLNECPVADRLFPPFFKKLVLASEAHASAKVKRLARALLHDLGINQELRERMKKYGSRRRDFPLSDEHILATRLANHKRPIL